MAANTTLAACAGGLTSMFFVYPRNKKWDTGITVNGFLGGPRRHHLSVLLGVACGRHLSAPSPASSCPRHRPPRVPAHRRSDRRRPGARLRGIWGTLSLGLFATGQFGIPTADGADTSTVVKGLFYGGGRNS